MIKLQSLALALAIVLTEVHKVYPMIPLRFLKMKGVSVIEIGFEGKKRIVKCASENGINDRINALNDLLLQSDNLRRSGYNIKSVTLMFGASRGNMQDTYYL